MAVHTTARSFQLAVAAFAGPGVERRRGQFTKTVAMEASSGVIFGTRQDTSRARANWQVGESDPPTGYDPDARDMGGSVTHAEAMRRIGAMSGLDIIWLHNGVPYINVLERWDKMVAGTVEALRTRIRSNAVRDWLRGIR